MEKVYRSEVYKGGIKKAIRVVNALKLAISKYPGQHDRIKAMLSFSPQRRCYDMARFYSYLTAMHPEDLRVRRIYVEKKGYLKRYRWKSRGIKPHRRPSYRYVATVSV